MKLIYYHGYNMIVCGFDGDYSLSVGWLEVEDWIADILINKGYAKTNGADFNGFAAPGEGEKCLQKTLF